MSTRERVTVAFLNDEKVFRVLGVIGCADMRALEFPKVVQLEDRRWEIENDVVSSAERIITYREKL